MSDVFERLTKLSPKRLALLAMELQSKLDAAERARHEPIAIVGMACRFPGAPDPDAYWQVLHDGVDVITEIPRSRWDVDAYYDPDPDAPGKIATRWGGFVDDIDRFEPQIFGISPREALSLDPQQRLLLEVSWEALERAGIAPDSLTGSPTGVFVGVCNGDYAHMLMEGDGADFDMYLATGNAYSVASGRLSYVLGLQGPALSVDTACSSSLLAVHLAVQSLRDGACSMALAGGANAILSPKTTMALSRARMMAPDGRCRPFDAGAAGFVRSEGCGIVVLKRLADAVADGDAVLAVIRGSAANQDGRSNGLTAPNGPSQVAVIRAALTDGAIAQGDVSYVETHGTGTSLGDPIEARALGAALGADRAPGNRLTIGSTKANVGHLESAAGIAGLIKVVLAMGHREIPPLLHLDRPNPHIPWDELPIDLPTSLVPWASAGDRLVAGVSSFGFSGTNVHVLLESAPVAVPPVPGPEEVAPRPLDVVTLSARTAGALQAMAGELAAHLVARPELSLADVAHTLGVGRSRFSHRLGLVAGDGAPAAAALAAFAAGEQPDGVVTGVVHGRRRPDVVFLFTGHGAQHPDMGRALYDTQPEFRDAIDRCAALLEPLMDVPLLDVLYDDRDGGSPFLDDMATSQPALFAVEWALTTLWRSWGVEPGAVAGHSAGEYVAAVVAGVMSLEDGLRLIAARGRLMSSLPPDGEMAAVFATEARVRHAIAPHGELISIAAVNGPESIAISGARDAVGAAVAELRAAGIEVRPLAIPIAAHSPQVDPILDAFEAVAASVSFHAPRLDVISGMHGRLAAGDDLVTARYWRQHLRQPVRFADALSAAYDGGRRVFIEVGPHPTLIGIARHVLPEQECAWLPSLRSGHDDWDQILRSVAGLFAAGGDVDWVRFDAPYVRRRVDLPTYPFERERYWAVVPAARRRAPAGPVGHPLLGRRLHSPAMAAVAFESTLGTTWPAFLDHHRIHGVALLPSPAYVEMALAAADEVLGAGPWTIEDLSIQEALILPDDGERAVQLVVSVDGPGAGFEVFSADGPGDGWTLHATGRLAPGGDTEAPAVPFATAAIQDRCATRIDGATYYGELFDRGLEFGESFRGLTEIWRRDGEALGRVVLPEVLAGEAPGYGIHPAFLDACFHLLGAPLPQRDDDAAYLLIAIDQFRLHARPGPQLWNHTVLRPGYEDGGDTFIGDVTLFDDDGTLVAEARGLHLKLAGRTALLRATRRLVDEWLYEVAWQPEELVPPDADTPAATAASWLILPDAGGVGEQLGARLGGSGDHVELLPPTGPDTLADTAELAARIAGLPSGPRHLVLLSSLDLPGIGDLGTDAVGRAADAVASEALALAQAAATSSDPTTMWIVTRGAQPAGGVVPAPLPAPLWGLGRVIALEQPERWGGLVDLAPDGTPDDDVDALLAELRHGDGEDQVARRQGGRLVPRLVRATPPDGASFAPRPDASYLITGGLGGLGLKIARWIVERGARHVTLTGRQGLPERAGWDALTDGGREASQVAAIRAIEALGATVEVVAADVADRDAMRAVVARFGADLPPLRGIVHAAAALSNWSVADMPQEALHAMLRPKVEGTLVLHELTAHLDLDVFVLFSSTTALWGSRDLAHYAAANAFLDAFAHHRRSMGLPALSINWGTWDEMRVASVAEQQMVARSGLDPMPSDQALRMLGELMTTDVAQVAVAGVDWDTLKGVYESRGARPFLSLVTSRRGPARSRPGAVERPELLHRLEGVADDERYGVVVRYLLDEVARTLGMTSVDDIDVGQGLFEMGMDSLMAVELKSRIAIAVAATLPSTLTFNYPTIEALAGYLTDEVLVDPDAPPAPAAPVTAPEPAAPAGAALDDLSEDDLAAMLAARLSRS